MPGDLRDPESYIPYHYDNKYDEAPNQFEPGAIDMGGYLQSIAFETLGEKISPEKLESVKQALKDKGYFHRNIGDEDFRNQASRLIKNIKMARKVVSQWLQI